MVLQLFLYAYRPSPWGPVLHSAVRFLNLPVSLYWPTCLMVCIGMIGCLWPDEYLRLWPNSSSSFFSSIRLLTMRPLLYFSKLLYSWFFHYAVDNCMPLSSKSSLTLSIHLFLCIPLLLSPLTCPRSAAFGSLFLWPNCRCSFSQHSWLGSIPIYLIPVTSRFLTTGQRQTFSVIGPSIWYDLPLGPRSLLRINPIGFNHSLSFFFLKSWLAASAP